MTADELPSFFRLAVAASEHGIHKQYFVGAVIMIKNKPVAVGFNQMKTHPAAGIKRMHAELSAVLSVKNKNRLQNASILIIRRTKSGVIGLARPCANCQRILAQYGIKTYIYTTSTGYVVENAVKNDKCRQNANFAKRLRS